MEDYNSAIRRALEEAAGEGLRVEIGNTGKTETRISYGGKYSRRLDSAVRQNVLDGIRSLNNANLQQLGEEFGADGVEISAHMLCAEDHLPYQGQQYSLQAFEDLQNSLPRPFGMWNCRHSIHPILLGISPNAYSDAELEEYRRYSTEKIEIDGATKSRYEWTQQQRRIETAVRRQKDVSIAARAAGDTRLRHDAQRTINALMDRYDKIADAAGVDTQYSRMRVNGFKHTGDKELRKDTQDPQKSMLVQTLQNVAQRGTITVAGQSVNTRIRSQKQQEHIIGTKAFDRRTEAAIANGRGFPSGFMAGTDVQALVHAHIGKGKVFLKSDGSISEYFSAENVIGWTYAREIGAYVQTNRVCIKYSKTGWHAFPVEEVSS